jgi:phage tail sheath protein FI
MVLQPTYPGTYVQETPSGAHPISGVTTAATAFVGYVARGPLNTPVQCLNFGDFQRVFGGLDPNSVTSFQVSQFFLNGGTEAWVSRLQSPDGLIPTGFDVAGNPADRTGIYALDAMDLVNLILIPDMPAMGQSDYLTAATATLNYAIQRKAFAILDMPNDIQTPAQAISWAMSTPGTFGKGIISAATYFPQVQVPNPFSTQPFQMGGSGTLAGIYALTDRNVGVWKAPAGITAPLAGVQNLSCVMNDEKNGQIDSLGINALRTFPIYDNVSWGARTMGAANIADEGWKYIPARRLALYIEQSLIQGLQWVVFEPNDERLWAEIRLSVNGFLHPLYLQGALVGASPSQAYQCICDASTTTPQDVANGIVNIEVLFAPERPAEFLVITLQQAAGQSSNR